MGPRAGFWIRFLAAMLDGIVAIILSVVFVLAYEAEWGRSFDADRAERIASLIFWIAWLAYSSFEIWTAGTPGKLVLGLRIAAVDGTRASRWRLLLRWHTKYFGAFYAVFFSLTGQSAFYWIAGISNAVVGIGSLFALNEDHLTWHDQWAGTAVCWKRRRVTSPPPLPAVSGVA